MPKRTASFRSCLIDAASRDQDRVIPLLDGATPQSFPEGGRLVHFGAPGNQEVVERLTGNDVPVKLGVEIATSLVQHVPKTWNE